MFDIGHINSQKRWKTFLALINMPAFFNDEQALKVINDLEKGDTTEREKALEYLNDGFALPWHYSKGKLTENGIFNKYYIPEQLRQKMVEGALLTHTNQPITMLSTWITDGNELNRDEAWRAVFRFENAQGTNLVKNVDVHNLAEWVDLDFGQAITYKPFLEDEAEFIRPTRKGGGIQFTRQAFNNGPMVTLNNAIVALRIKALDKKIADAYTLIDAANLAAETAGQVTAFATSIAHTINLGKIALLRRNANKGWGLSFMSTPVQLIGSVEHMDTIEAAFRTVQVQDLTIQEVNRPLNITRHYTDNLATDLDLVAATASVMLCLRGYKSIDVEFDSIRFNTEQNFDQDMVKVGGQEYDNGQVETDQIEIVELV